MTLEHKIVMNGSVPYASLDLDDTLAGDDDFRIPSQKAIKAYIASKTRNAGSIARAYIDFNATAEAEAEIIIGGVTYAEADTAVPATGVFTNGASAANSAASLLAAINGDLRASVPFTAYPDDTGDGLWLYFDTVGAAGNLEITTDSASNCTVEDFTGGVDVSVSSLFTGIHAVTTQQLLSGEIHIPLPFTPSMIQISALDGDGAPVFFTDQVTVELEPDRLVIITTGATNLGDGDTIHIYCTD